MGAEQLPPVYRKDYLIILLLPHPLFFEENQYRLNIIVSLKIVMTLVSVSAGGHISSTFSAGSEPRWKNARHESHGTYSDRLIGPAALTNHRLLSDRLSSGIGLDRDAVKYFHSNDYSFHDSIDRE